MAKGPRTGRVGGRTSRAPVRQLLADTLAPEPAVEVDADSLTGRRPQASPDAAGPRLRRGFSHHIDARRAAVELHDAIAQPDTAFVLVFCSPQYDLAGAGRSPGRRVRRYPGDRLHHGGGDHAGRVHDGIDHGGQLPAQRLHGGGRADRRSGKLRDRPRPGAGPKPDRQARRRLSGTSTTPRPAASPCS